MTIRDIKPYALPSADELPVNRLPWRPDARRAVLLVHDMQRYFVRFYQPDQSPMREALANMVQLIAAARRAGIPVVYTAQPSDASRPRFLVDLWGPGLTAYPQLAGIVDELSPLPGDTVLGNKTRYSAFHETDLAHIVRGHGRDQLWICGLYAHIGCMITAFDAFMHDIEPFLALDALMDFSREHHDLAGRMVSDRCGVVLATQAFVSATESAPDDWAAQLVNGSLERLFAIERAQLSDDMHLRDAGLDSVRMMELAEELRSRGHGIESVDVMECQALHELHAAVRRAPFLEPVASSQAQSGAAP